MYTFVCGCIHFFPDSIGSSERLHVSPNKKLELICAEVIIVFSA